MTSYHNNYYINGRSLPGTFALDAVLSFLLPSSCAHLEVVLSPYAFLPEEYRFVSTEIQIQEA